MNARKGSVAIALVCALLAFALTWQMRSVTALGGVTNSTAKARADQLQAQLTAEQEKNEALYNQIIEYKDELQAFSDAAEKSGGYAKVLTQRLEQTMILAGQTTVTGPGVQIVLSDSRKLNTAGVDENNFVIHDEDLLRVVNELRDAGAEAIAINGERLLATSEIRCAGSIVSVNNNRYAAPYTITAIGDAKELYNAMTMRQGVIDTLSIWGIQCDISKEAALTIEGYSGAVEYQYAVPVKANTETGEAAQ